MAQALLLKDQLFNAETVGYLAGLFGRAGVFDPAPFVADVMGDLDPLELKARINLIADVLETHLPDGFDQVADAMTRALPAPLDPNLSDDDFGHFIFAPLGVVVERQAVAGHFGRGLDMLETLTQRFSMEFSIRAFLNHDAAATLDRMRDWLDHDHYHVRRLVSEGTRPRLPWGVSVGLNPDQTLPLLDRLHADPTRFVTRSVANHLNDLTRLCPDQVLARLVAWQAARAQTAKELDWMRRHTLRSLIKAGHPGAMAHLGYDADVAVQGAVAITPDDLAIGDAAEIAVTLTTQTDAPLIVDYVIDFVKSNGTTAPKVFKLKVLEAKAGQPVTLKKRHLFKKGATTFTHYPGAHRVHVQVNGVQVAQVGFVLS